MSILQAISASLVLSLNREHQIFVWSLAFKLSRRNCINNRQIFYNWSIYYSSI